MENRIVLDKTAIVEDSKVIITEQVETKYNLEQVESRLSNIQRDKQRLAQENKYILSEYDRLTTEEIEFKGYLLELQSGEIIIEEIK